MKHKTLHRIAFALNTVLLTMMFALISCQEPSGLDTDRITKIIDSTTVKPALLSPIFMQTELIEDVPGVISYRTNQNNVLYVPYDTTKFLSHSLSNASFIKIDTSSGRIRYTGNLTVFVKDTQSDFLPGNLKIPRYTRLHTINITLDSLANDIDIVNSNGVQRKEVKADFISHTNGASAKKTHKLTSVRTTFVYELLGTRFSVLHFTATIPLSQPITLEGLTLNEFATDFTIIAFW